MAFRGGGFQSVWRYNAIEYTTSAWGVPNVQVCKWGVVEDQYKSLVTC